jgi:hypothetical protein
VQSSTLCIVPQKDDMPILCERYTTSKLRTYDDLQVLPCHRSHYGAVQYHYYHPSPATLCCLVPQ